MEIEEKSRKFIELMHRFKRLNRNQFMDGLSQGEFMMLVAISSESKDIHQGISISFLANIMEVSTPAVSRMLTNLENKRYVQRHANEKDHRNTNVCITELGQEALSKGKQKMKAFQIRVLSQMEENEVDEFLRLLGKIQGIMKEEWIKEEGKDDK